MRPLVLALLALSVAAWTDDAEARRRPARCPDARYMVAGTTLTGVPGVSDGIVVADRRLSIDSGCAPARLTRRSPRKGDRMSARWKQCTGVQRAVRLRATVASPGCDTLEGVVKRKGSKKQRFVATRTRCGDGIPDAASNEACDDGNTTACDGCAADCSHEDRCVDGLDCSAYARPARISAPCDPVDATMPDELGACVQGSGNVGTWTVDADGLPAYDFDVDQRCDTAARAYSPRSYPLRDPVHAIGNGLNAMAMARASGAVEYYTQERGHKWLNKVDLWVDPENPDYPPQIGGGFSYYTVAGRVGSTRFEDLPVGAATANQTRRFGVGYVETVTRDQTLTIRRRTFAPAVPREGSLVVDVEIANAGTSAAEVGLVELWDVNLHQVSVELLTSDLLDPAITDGIERRRRAQAAAFTHELTWDLSARTAVVTTTAKSLPAGVQNRYDPAHVDFFPDAIWLGVLDDGPAPDRVWLTDTELWPDGTRTPPASILGPGDGAPSRGLSLDGAGQRALLAVRVPVTVPAGGAVARRFAFGTVSNGSDPAVSIGGLRTRGPDLAATTAANWRERLVWAAFPGLPDAAVVQRELAWAAYGALASVSYDEYRGFYVLGQGGSYRFIHGLDGAMGDLALFAEAMLLVDPVIASETLAYALSTQHATTEATPGRFPYATTGVGQYSDVGIYSRRSDAYWFLPSIIGQYVGVTGSASFLTRFVPYWPHSAGENGTVLDHIARGLDFAENETELGYAARGLVAMGTNDYADGINALATEPVTPTGTSSTYNAGMIALGFRRAAEVVAPLDPTLAMRLDAIFQSQSAALLDQAWSGQYFHRGFVDSGNPLAPHIFFLEPQVFPALSGIAGPTMVTSALDTVAALLETPYGAISNVPIGASGPVGGIDQPLIGGVWPVANAWLTAAYARRDTTEGWSSFVRNTLAAHAEAFPDLWYGIWTGPDSFNGPGRERPGEADAHLATALTDYPALNAHMHTGPLRALAGIVGVEGTADGLRIAPRVPTETFSVHWPRLRLDWRPDRIAGDMRYDATVPTTLTLSLPSQLAGLPTVQATVNGTTSTLPVVAGVVTLPMPASPGVRIVWAVEAMP